jgi:hypothetical protein
MRAVLELVGNDKRRQVGRRLRRSTQPAVAQPRCTYGGSMVQPHCVDRLANQLVHDSPRLIGLGHGQVAVPAQPCGHGTRFTS